VLRPLSHLLCTALIGCLAVLVPWQQAQAAALSTEALARVAHSESGRARVLALLEREDVARGLQSYGVHPDEARARVNALSDAEIASIAGQLERLPAGADTAGAILLGLLIGFAALVITDMLGWTDVFPTVGPYSR
jgi:hypothetical protein